MTTTTKVKIPPHSKESEMMVLGCMLTSINGLSIASDALDDSDFYFNEHKIIFQVLKTSHKKDKPADIHLVAEELKRQDKLTAVGGLAYLTTLAQFSGTSAFIEEYVEAVRDKSQLRRMIHAAQLIEKTALEEPLDVDAYLEDAKQILEDLGKVYGTNISALSPKEMLENEKSFLNKHRGKEYIGLRVSAIPEFNENFLGLRGLILLAAAPNVGKTALTVQTGIDVLSTEKDACLIYVSLEMSKEQIFRRMLLNLSGMDFKTYVFGSQKLTSQPDLIEPEKNNVLLLKEEIESIKNAEKKLLNFGHRLQIIDQSICPRFDSRTIINYINSVKSTTKCKRPIVIIDYLQVWPLPQNSKFTSDIEADKWRIGEIKKIRDAISQDDENPVIVISEARKPSGKEETWGGDLSDVMGSARGTYTPDIVMLQSQLKPKALKDVWKKNNMPKVKVDESLDCGEDDKEGLAIKNILLKNGISICKLEVPKVRDGMKKFNMLLEFRFNQNIFKKLDWEALNEAIDL